MCFWDQIRYKTDIIFSNQHLTFVLVLFSLKAELEMVAFCFYSQLPWKRVKTGQRVHLLCRFLWSSCHSEVKHHLFSCQFLTMLVGTHLVNNWPSDPHAPSLSTFRRMRPLNGDVLAGMDMPRLVVHPPPPNPPPHYRPSLPVNHGDFLEGICSSFKWFFKAVLFSGSYSWQQLPCRTSDYSHILGVQGLFCGYDIMNTGDIHDLSGACLCAWLNPGYQRGD